MRLRSADKPIAAAPAVKLADNGASRRSRSPASTSTPVGASKVKWRTLKYDDLPEWRRDNEYLRSGYAPITGTLGGTLRTVFRLHNETVNVWTHLLGTLAFAALSSWLLAQASPQWTSTGRLGYAAPFALIWPFPSSLQPSVTLEDTVYLFLFFASAITCLGLSATFHASLAHSKEISVALNRGDYVGIVVLIVGSNYPALHYGFYCHRRLKHSFMALVTIFGAAAMYTVLAPRFRTGAYRRLRTYVFIALGLSAVLPVAAALWLYGLEGTRDNFSLGWLALSGALYIGGALLYAERFPERWRPGRFDLIGASHQIFHVIILLAAWAHYCCVAEGFRHWHHERLGSCIAAP